MGAWIEIVQSLSILRREAVAPLVGAWIEIDENGNYANFGDGRAPRGRVD